MEGAVYKPMCPNQQGFHDREYQSSHPFADLHPMMYQSHDQGLVDVCQADFARALHRYGNEVSEKARAL